MTDSDAPRPVGEKDPAGGSRKDAGREPGRQGRDPPKPYKAERPPPRKTDRPDQD